MVQSIDNGFNKGNYSAVKINISKPEVFVGGNNNQNSVATNPINSNGDYNAVNINIDNPTVHAEPVHSIYDYPQAQAPLTYDMAQINPVQIPQGFNLAYHTTNVILPKMENELEVESKDFEPVKEFKTVDEAEETEEAEKPETTVKPEVPVANYTTVEAEKGEKISPKEVENEENVEEKSDVDSENVNVAIDDSENDKTEVKDNVVKEDEVMEDALSPVKNDDVKEADEINDDVKVMDSEVKEIEKKRPEIIAGEEIQPDVDIPLVISNLTSDDYDVQAQQMEEIARISMDNSENAIPYIVRDVFSTLIDITKADTSELASPSEEQVQARKKVIANYLVMENAKGDKNVKLPYELSDAEINLANQISPMEQAERNKEYAMYTMAVLAKIYTDEVEKQTGNVVPMTDLPGTSAIVDALRYNPNPEVKLAAIDALSHIERPEYKEELATLFTLAQTDTNPLVAMSATRALEKANNQ